MMLAVVEDAVMHEGATAYKRIHAWWVSVQSQATLRFSDHCGVLPSELTVDANGLIGRITRWKTLGSDRDVVARPITVDPCCHFKQSAWLTTG